MCASPLIVTGPDQAAVEQRLSDVRARIAFYASTKSYRAVFDTHGWDDVAERLRPLSLQQRWDEMERQVTDEMVETIAVVAPYDDLADAIRDRYGDLCAKVEFSIPVNDPDDGARLTEMVRRIQEPVEAGTPAEGSSGPA